MCPELVPFQDKRCELGVPRPGDLVEWRGEGLPEGVGGEENKGNGDE
jgi:hypothetical protein